MRFLPRWVSCGALVAAAAACSSDDAETPNQPKAGSGGMRQNGGTNATGGAGAGNGGTAPGGTGAIASGGTGGGGTLGGSGGDAGETGGGGSSGTSFTQGTCADYTSKLQSCSIMTSSIDCSVAPVGNYLPCMYGCYAAAPCAQIVDGTCGDTGNAFVDCMLVCDALEFDCGGGQRLPAGFQCDAVPDCDNGSDEDGCPPFDSAFTCGDASTIPAGFRCDGFEDCEDASDESGCPSVKCPPPPVPVAGEACGKAATKLESCGVLPGGVMTSCLDRTAQAACEKTCLADASCEDLLASLCEGAGADAVLDCLEACQNESDSFPCPEGELIPSFFLCDDVNDCEDGSDEKDCAFVCKNGESVPYKSTCDDTRDCKDGSDEDGCGPTCPAP